MTEREIKFRAYWKEYKRIFEVREIDWKEQTCNLLFDLATDVEHKEPLATARLEDVILMQYTGLKDENGVEVWEGDIVKCLPVNCEHFEKDEIEEEDYAIDVIIFEDGCFRLKDQYQWNDGDHHWYSLENSSPEDIEVIGNIYENPELLKSE